VRGAGTLKSSLLWNRPCSCCLLVSLLSFSPSLRCLTLVFGATPRCSLLRAMLAPENERSRRCVAHRGTRERKALSKVPARVASCLLEESSRSSDLTGTISPHLCSLGPDADGAGRYHGTALGPKDPSARDRSRSDAQSPFALRHNQWAALVEPAAAGGDSVGGTGVGFAVFDHTCSFQTL
jgi:hypothetical protein